MVKPAITIILARCAAVLSPIICCRLCSKLVFSPPGYAEIDAVFSSAVAADNSAVRAAAAVTPAMFTFAYF